MRIRAAESEAATRVCGGPLPQAPLAGASQHPGWVRLSHSDNRLCTLTQTMQGATNIPRGYARHADARILHGPTHTCSTEMWPSASSMAPRNSKREPFGDSSVSGPQSCMHKCMSPGEGVCVLACVRVCVLVCACACVLVLV